MRTRLVSVKSSALLQVAPLGASGQLPLGAVTSSWRSCSSLSAHNRGGCSRSSNRVASVPPRLPSWFRTLCGVGAERHDVRLLSEPGAGDDAGLAVLGRESGVITIVNVNSPSALCDERIRNVQIERKRVRRPTYPPAPSKHVVDGIAPDWRRSACSCSGSRPA